MGNRGRFLFWISLPAVRILSMRHLFCFLLLFTCFLFVSFHIHADEESAVIDASVLKRVIENIMFVDQYRMGHIKEWNRQHFTEQGFENYYRALENSGRLGKKSESKAICVLGTNKKSDSYESEILVKSVTGDLVEHFRIVIKYLKKDEGRIAVEQFIGYITDEGDIKNCPQEQFDATLYQALKERRDALSDEIKIIDKEILTLESLRDSN